MRVTRTPATSGTGHGVGCHAGAMAVASDETNWASWHHDYADPTSPLSQRLRVVVSLVQRAVGLLPPGPISVISARARNRIASW